MQESAATLNQGKQRGELPTVATPDEQALRRGAGGMRFTYANGARPLDGFTIKRGIGIGGFGEVYFAHSDAGKEVALKRVQRNLDVELRGVTQCLNLKHVNLISLYDIKYDQDGQAWVVMEFVAGESLKDLIERHAQGLPPAEADRWFRGIAAGVSYLHDHGIVHRDLKPGNIFDDAGQVKIGDYGLSKFISCSRRSGQTESVGTFHYMAPEIGKGVYGKEIDIYALGIILHELLTGRVPFDGETSQEIILKHLTADPDLRGLPGPYVAVIRKALAKDPVRRFTSVGEMLAALPPLSVVDRAAARGDVLVIGETVYPAQRASEGEPLYIGDEAAHPDIVFGPVRDRSPAGAESPPGASAVESSAPEEPIARAIRQSWRRFHSSFEDSQWGATLKIVVLAVAGLLLLANAAFFMPLAVFLGVMYLIYYGVRAMMLSDVSAAPVAPRPLTRKQLLAEAREGYRNRPVQERFAELAGSLLASAAAAATLSLLAILLVGKPFALTLEFWSFWAWLSLVAAVGAWMLLVSGKWWEGSEGDAGARRLTAVLLGLTVGAFACGLGVFLKIDFQDLVPPQPHMRPLHPAGWYTEEGVPQFPVFLGYFAALFAVPRWWKAADPLRRHRVSLIAACFVALWAWALHLMLAFTFPLGVMVSIIISLATQLASPWFDWKQTRAARLAG